MSYVDGLDAASLRIGDANDTHAGDTEEIESCRADDGSRTQFAGGEPASYDLDTRQHDLGSARAESHQRQVGHCVIPDLATSTHEHGHYTATVQYSNYSCRDSAQRSRTERHISTISTLFHAGKYRTENKLKYRR